MTKKKSDVVEETPPAPAEDTRTSDELLTEIEEQQRQLEEGEEKEAETPPEPEPSKEKAEEEDAADKQAKEGATSEPPEATDPEGSHKAEIDEWMKKKGLDTPEKLSNYLRGLDRDFHRARKEGKDAQVTQFPAREISHAPPMQGPAYPYDVRTELARHFDVAPEDLEKILKVSELVANVRIQPLRSEMERLKRDTSRDREIARLESDPLFHNREVQYEMSRILEADPSIMGREPEPLVYAFNQGLANMARRFVSGKETQPTAPGETRQRPPATPPPTGRSTGGGVKGVSIKPSEEMSPEKFNRLSSAEQERYLKSKGAWQTDIQ